jgi:hypothetical protein
MMSENIAQNMYSTQGTINYPTQLHLVGHFCKNCILMHGFMNVKNTYSFSKSVPSEAKHLCQRFSHCWKHLLKESFWNTTHAACHILLKGVVIKSLPF